MQECFKPGFLVLIAALYSFNAGIASAWADDQGRRDYMANCASCHGVDGKGHGEALYVIPGVKPADLTILSRNNQGVFPAHRVYESIDGRNGIPAHERFDMPFWGTTFQREGAEFTPASEHEVKARIMKIVDYIKSIQQK
jgi:mono/diheme cytochrome c family protein